MKEKDAHFSNEHQLVCYVEKEDGTYGPVETSSYMVEHYFDDFLEKRKRLENNYFKKLCDGEISPVEYFMVLIDISAAELASRIGISTGKVRKHKDPKHFAKISIPLIKRYARVFRIPVANMFQVITSKNPELKIKQQKTQNPMIVITNAEESASEQH